MDFAGFDPAVLMVISLIVPLVKRWPVNIKIVWLLQGRVNNFGMKILQKGNRLTLVAQ